VGSGEGEMSTIANKTGTLKQVDLWELVRLANEGEEAAIAKLREELRGKNADALLSICCDLAFQAEKSILSVYLGEQIGSRLLMQEKLTRMRAEFGWDGAPKLERVLIERIVQTWLSVNLAEISNAQAAKCSVGQAKFNQERIDRAQQRHLSAIKTLAVVRKMALPLRVEIKAEVSVAEPAHTHINRFDFQMASAN